MSERIGPINYSGGKHQVFLGLEMTQNTNHCSEEMAKTIDAEVRRIVAEQYDRTAELLASHRAALEAIGEALLEHETLSGAEVQIVVDGGSLDRRCDLDEARDEESENN